jgi:PAS domain S-box-containing protein
MITTIRFKMLLLISLLMCAVAVLILLTTKTDFKKAIHHVHHQLDEDILQFAARAVEAEYKELVSQEMNMIQRRRDLMKQMLSGIRALIEAHHYLYQTGVLTEEQARRLALEKIKNVHYGLNQYFFVCDMNLMGLAHPVETMIGKKWTGFMDIKEKEALPMIKESLETHDSVHTVLFWPRLSDQKPVKQMGYFSYYPQWEWIIGTCVELDDIEKDADYIKGVVAQKLRDIFKEASFAGAGYLFVFDGQGHMVIHPEIAGKNASGLVDEITGQPLLKRLNHKTIGQGPILCSFAVDGKIQPQFIHMAYFRALDWHIGCSVFQETLSTPVEKLMSRQAWIIGGILLTGILIAAFMSMKIARPIALLAQYARRLPEKDFTKENPSDPNEFVEKLNCWEVNQLARAFMFMETQLTAHMQEIEKHRAHLEELVAERTEKLSNVNARLEQEILERKEADTALRQSEERYRLIFEQSPLGIMHFDPNGVIVECNENFAAIIGAPREKLIGLNMIRSMPEGPARSAVENALMHGMGTFEGIYHTVTGDRDIFIKAVHKRISGPDDTILGAVGVFEDISTRKKLESQLRQAHKMEAIGTLAGGIAHDFNNILGIIIGNVELASDSVDKWNPARQRLEKVIQASFRARDVVRQLLSFSRKTEQERKPIQISPIIKESLKLLRSSIPKNIEIIQDVKHGNSTILGDPTQVHQVLINLCANAAHAMSENGGILSIGLSAVTLDEESSAHYTDIFPGRYTCLTVSDTGCGIAPDIIGKIFDPYFTTKDVGKGTGMGLALVHGIVKSHGGAVSVYSKPGKGTTFKILFPAVEREAESNSPAPNPLPRGKERILFVDDEEFLSDIGCQQLSVLGYAVESLNDPIKALDLFRTDPDRFDLVITDMTMPRMTGDILTREILKVRPDIPVILCTGFSERISRERARDIGIYKYLEKPLDRRELAFTVREVLDTYAPSGS